MDNKFRAKLEKVLKSQEDFVDPESGSLNYTRVKDAADRADHTLVKLLSENKDTKDKFFSKIGDVYVFEINDFKFFLDENKVDNSYTKYQNKIGLSTSKGPLTEQDNVVLDFPFKDCVLQGGQSSEEGVDSYFEFDEKVSKSDEKKGRKANSYNLREDKREEIFFNQILAEDEIDRLFDDKALVNFKRFSEKGEDKVKNFKRDDSGELQENLIVKGNNLVALHSLYSNFNNRVKLIYIDPPYNTGNDSFAYNDRFNRSTWLTFIKNRLEIAREFLTDDGLIFIQCDDSQQPYLKILMDELFGASNHQSTIYTQVRYADKQLATAMKFHKLIETIFVYSKTDSPLIYQQKEEYDLSKYIYEIVETSKPTRKIKLGGKSVQVFEPGSYEIVKKDIPSDKLLKEIWASGKILDSSSTGRFFRDYLEGRVDEDGLGVLYKVEGIGSGLGYRYITGPKKEGATKGKYYQEVPIEKISAEYEGDSKAISNFYDMAAEFGNCRLEGGVGLRSGKKPEALLKKIIEMSTKEGDYILDFFGGSGTTGAVAHKMGRNYILVEQMDYINDLPEERLKNVIKGDQTGISKEIGWKGGGEFVYLELAEWNEKAKNIIQDSKSLKELVKNFGALYEKYFFNYNVKVKDFYEKVIKEKEFLSLGLDRQKEMFLVMLDLNQMYVQASEVGDKRFGVTAEDKKLTKEFYA